MAAWHSLGSPGHEKRHSRVLAPAAPASSFLPTGCTLAAAGPSRVISLTGHLAQPRRPRDDGLMVTPAVIGGFATLDGVLLGQVLYALTHYPDREGRQRD